ncbi:MAG: oligosaccharide flippase family protein [Acidobacteria bacterium]|nr:oligosaccharide flippase family protein [Acidobacteriota bacterium]MBV9145087.1 oligosaccharide flippase family protein [Acidobacteriota bacterium]MBV9436018.1 oligosaccharide flippase family protein [Acidobacteriota bacterium]
MSSDQSTISLPLRDGIAVAPKKTGLNRTASVVLSGSLILLLGSVLVSALNFLFNVIMARLLGPALFSQAAALVTLLMLLSCISLSFQMVCAKFVARNETPGAKITVYRTMSRQAWRVGGVVALLLLAAQKPIADYLRMPNSWVIAVLAIGMAFYNQLGVKRGNLQGWCRFGSLSRNYIFEAASKLAIAILLVELGYGIWGVVGSLSASIIAAVLLTGKRTAEPDEVQDAAAVGDCIPASFGEGIQAIVFFIGQVIINNVDIILVKHFFANELAGLYAAVALVGRLLYFASWQVVSAMFPVSAASGEKEHGNAHVLGVPLVIVSLMCFGFILISTVFPGFIMHVLFGEGFHSGKSLLSLYAVSTALYALAMVLITYEMSRKIANTGWLQLLFSGAIVLAIYLFHSDLRQVIMVQVWLKVGMLLLVSLPFLRSIPFFRWKEVA